MIENPKKLVDKWLQAIEAIVRYKPERDDKEYVLNLVTPSYRSHSVADREMIVDGVMFYWFEKRGHMGDILVIHRANYVSKILESFDDLELAQVYIDAYVDETNKANVGEPFILYAARDYVFSGDFTRNNPEILYRRDVYPQSAVEAGKLVRVRFAPSPTGSLHIGGLRTALFNYLFAKGEMERKGLEGQFILRIEDTDQSRLVKSAVQEIVDMLAWVGIKCDEGPHVGGPFGPYTQSERLDIYKRYAKVLLDKGLAYKCFTTAHELKEMREAQERDKQPVGYDRRHRDLTPEQIADFEARDMPYVVRFKMPREGTTVVTDMLRGDMVFHNENLEDLVLMKSDGFPTYHMANVVDDHFMGITHVFRGEEWISTAPLHVQLYNAFEWQIPEICHLPLIMAPGGGKLSKRHGATSVAEFKKLGYAPQALVNYLALVGWSFDGETEVFSMDDLKDKFSMKGVHAAPATFDYAKLAWFNQHYINHILTESEIVTQAFPFLFDEGLCSAHMNEYEFADLKRIAKLYKDRIKTYAEVPYLFKPFLTHLPLTYETNLLVPKGLNVERTYETLVDLYKIIDELPYKDFESLETLEQVLREYADNAGLKAGQVFMMLRVATMGRTESPGIFETIRQLGGYMTQQRIEEALEYLEPLMAEAAVTA